MVRPRAAALAAVFALTGCTVPAEDPPVVVVTSTTFVEPPLIDAPVHHPAPNPPAELAVAVPGEATGLPDATPAWSTIKVPIAIAALRANPDLYPDAVAAITLSDNAAAQRLYAAAGPEAVNQVLAQAGLAVGVNTAPIRPEFSTFGQTLLTASDEAGMADGLACVPGASPVLQLMGQVDPSQAFGLGTIEGALYKGGWGPDPAGMYHVRQFGLIPRGDGTYAPVAMTALPPDGTFESGQAMLSEAAQDLAARAHTLPAATCQP